MEGVIVKDTVSLKPALDYIKSGAVSLNEVAIIAKRSAERGMGEIFLQHFFNIVRDSVAKKMGGSAYDITNNN